MSRIRFLSFAAAAVAAGMASTACAQPSAGGLATQVAPGAYVVTDHGANLVLIVDPAGSMVAGVQSPALVARAKQALSALHAAPVRYALLMDGPGAPAFMDGGWENGGAVAVAHEVLRGEIRRAARDSTHRPPAGARVPAIGYSQVMQVALGREEAHCVKQPAGYSEADAAIHFEGAKILYLNSFTSDGYPDVDVEHGGTLAGVAATAAAFAANFESFPDAIEPIVPARGPLAKLQDLRDFRDMLVAVHASLTQMIEQGRTVEQAVAAHPTARFDARWGHGPVTPDRFVRTAYAAIVKERQKEAEERAHSH